MPLALNECTGILDGWIAPTGGVTNKTPVTIQNCLVIPMASASATATFAGYSARLAGKKLATGVVKATGATWAVGQSLYHDGTSFTTASTGNTLRAVAATAAASGDTTGDVILTD